MRKLLVVFTIFLMASTADAQSTGSTYRTALGVKVWDGAGISFKHFRLRGEIIVFNSI